jgi:hypothetical protein
MLRAFREGSLAIRGEALTAAVQTANPNVVYSAMVPAILAMEQTIERRMPVPLLDCLIQSAQAMFKRDGSLRLNRRTPVSLTFSFDKTNPEAIRWAETQAAKLVVDVSESTRRAIREIISRAFEEGLAPREAAKLIRSAVGLTHQQSMAVINLRMQLLEAKPGTRVRGVRVPKTGASGDFVNKVGTKYADRLRKQRALTIARTETVEASNVGQQLAWKEAKKEGLLTNRALREWIVTPDDRLCLQCLPMSGATAPIDGTFKTPEGRSVSGPPLHPRCRCGQGLRP